MPSLVVSTGKTVLRTSSGKRLPFANPRWRLPLTLVSMRSPTEVMVKITGAMEVYGLAALKELGVLVCKPGPMGSGFYAGDHNMLQLRSSVKDGQLTVGGAVRIRVHDHNAGVPYPKQFRVVPFEAPIRADRLCKAIPPRKHAGTGKDPHVVRQPGQIHRDDFPSGTAEVEVKKGETLTLRASPGGEVVHTRAPSKWDYALMRIGQHSGWDQVAVGGGPYLLGWMPTRPEYKPERFGIGGLLGTMGKRKGPASLHTRKLKALPLHRLPAGATLQQFGVVHARLLEPGYARVITRQDKWIYVAAAVDADVKVEGWIEPSSLGEKVE